MGGGGEGRFKSASSPSSPPPHPPPFSARAKNPFTHGSPEAKCVTGLVGLSRTVICGHSGLTPLVRTDLPNQPLLLLLLLLLLLSYRCCVCIV